MSRERFDALLKQGLTHAQWLKEFGMGAFEDDMDIYTTFEGKVQRVREWLIANRTSLERGGVQVMPWMVINALNNKVGLGEVLEGAKREHWTLRPTDAEGGPVLAPPSREAWECMIDLETWGLPPNGLIVSIGAVMFDPVRNLITDRFQVGIDPEISVQWGFDIQPGTMMWWLDPNRDAARQAWLKMPKVDLASALTMFNEWYGTTSVPTWGNGADFDLTLMTNSYKKLNLEPAWHFRHVRCYRTLKNLVKVPYPETGLHHDALDDARWQSEHLMGMLERMRQRSV